MVAYKYSGTTFIVVLMFTVIHSYPLNATSESITERNEKQSNNTENIEDIFAAYENKFIKNDTWIKEDINLRKNTDFDESGSEEADDLLHTTQTMNEIVHAVHEIINGLAASDIQNRTDEPMDQSAVIVMTTSVYTDASSNTKYKQHHTELSFGNNDLIPRQQKTSNIDGTLDMHNRITTEFFNDISVATEISSPQALTGQPVNQPEDNRHLDNIPSTLNVSVADTVPPVVDAIHDPADAFASILDADIREEFTKDIPGDHHIPAYAAEEILEYSPLEDSSAFLVKAEQIETTPSTVEPLKITSTDQDTIQKQQGRSSTSSQTTSL